MKSDVVVSVQLTIAEDSGRRLVTAPENITIGEMRINRWQVHPVDKPGGLFDGSAAYLVKINYELELKRGLQGMAWFELALHLDSEDAEATILDALPHSASTLQTGCSYGLNQHLQLVPVQNAIEAQAYLPTITEKVDLHGIGRSYVRWRHSTNAREGIAAGSRSAWFLMLVPENRVNQPFQLVARYDLRTDEDTPYWPTQEPAEFVIPLVESTKPHALRPSVTTSAQKEPEGNAISVFICYAHDSADHKVNAKRFATVLLDEGLDVHMDQLQAGPKQDWAIWSLKQYRNVDFVLVLASPMCAAVGDGTADPEKHPGLRSELRQLRTLLQRYPGWERYVLPVILPGQTKFGIPIFLGPESEDYYEVDDYTSTGVDYLLSAMRKTERRTWPLT